MAMAREKPTAGAHNIPTFCDARGYRNAVGTSQRPAMAAGEFDSSLSAVHQRDIDARYADVMSVGNLIVYSTRSHSRAKQPI
jgi:hypothetical protein